MPKRGLLIAFEGIDGSGKSVQAQLVADRLRKAGKTVATLSFPDYDSPYGRAIADGLHGRGLDFRTVDPKVVSLFFMADRGRRVPGIWYNLQTGTIVLCNRYAASNAAYQGARIEGATRPLGFIDWTERVEFNELKHPRPDRVLFLDVPPTAGVRLRQTRPRQDDHYETDLVFQTRVAEIYRMMAASRDNWSTICCTTNTGAILPSGQIHATIWSVVEPMLAAQSAV